MIPTPRLFAFIFTILSTTFATFSQTTYICGRVSFADSTAGSYTLQLLERNGTTALTTPTVRQTPDFSLAASLRGKGVLRLSAVGYKTVELTLQAPQNSDSIQLGNLQLLPLGNQLGEAVVDGRRPAIRTKGSLTTIDIKNTVLSDIGTVQEMLKRTPGLVYDGAGGFRVMGRGEVLIEIDGKEVMQKLQLETLKSDQVDQVEIDRAPSAAYAGDVGAVVRIKTKHQQQDNIFLKVSNSLTQRQRTLEYTSADFRFKLGKVTAALTANYGADGNFLRETYFRTIAHSDYTFGSTTDVRVPIWSHGPSTGMSLDWDINKHNTLSLMYLYRNDTYRIHSVGTTVREDKEATTVTNLHEGGKEFSNLHNVSMTYILTTRKKTTLYAITDFATPLIRRFNDTQETNNDTGYTSSTNSNTRRRYNALTSQLYYYFKLPKKISAFVGVKNAYIHSSINQMADFAYGSEENYWSRSKMDNDKLASFVDFSRRSEKFYFRLGLRHEYEYTNLDAWGNSDDNSGSTKTHFSRFVPNLRLSFTPNDDWNIDASYRRYAMRVNFNQLLPGTIYKDSLTYESGNIAVEPSVTDRATIDISWKDWTLSGSFDRTTNTIQYAYLNLDQTTNVLTYQAFNFGTSSEWNVGLSYSKQFKKLKTYAEAVAIFPHMRYPYNGAMRLANMTAWEGNLNLGYDLTKQWSISSSLHYQSAKESGIVYLRPRYVWEMALTGSLLQDRLTVSLRATDILRGENYNRVTDRIYNVRSGTFGYSDMRGIKLRVAYTIFNKPLRLSATSGNDEELMRLK